MTKTVIGIFDDSTAAQKAFERLTASGFAPDEIDITNRSDNELSDGEERQEHTEGDFGDRVSRFFKNLFDDEQDSETFASAAKAGTVVSVYTDSSEEAERVADILDEAGAINVNDRIEATEGNARRSGLSQETTEFEGELNEDRNSSDRSIPVIEEELKVGKREVETGGMRLRSRIIDRPVEENLRLRQERVTLERTPVNRPATDSDLNTFRDGEIEVRERSEVPVVNKEARVVEEIRVRKDVEEREEVVRDTVRKTDVEVDDIEGNKESMHNKSRPRKKG